MPSEIEHPRTCEACGSQTYQFERCHECGDKHWEGGDA